jgi:hypothetical protein
MTTMLSDDPLFWMNILDIMEADMSEKQPTEIQDGLLAASDTEITELYAQMEPEQVISPGDRRNLVKVAEAIHIATEHPERPLGEPPQERRPKTTVPRTRRVKVR